MAVTSGIIKSSTSNYSYLYVKWQQVSQSSDNNTTTINWQAGINVSSSAYWGNNTIRFDNVYINGTKVQSSITTGNISTNGDHTIASGTTTISHNDDGTKTFSMSFSGWLYGAGTLTGSGNFELTTIPRYITITRYVAYANNANSIIVGWGVDGSWDIIQYSLNGGSWTNAPQQDDPFTITGLSANTTYTLKIRVKATASGLWTASSSKSITTYKVPTQSVSSKTETKITMAWSCDSTVDYVWYKIGSGSWIPVGNVNATSGTYPIDNLTPNTPYNIYTRVKRYATQVTDDTAVLSVTTYKDAVFSLKSKTEKSFTFNWSAESKLSKIEYRYKLSTASSYPSSWTDAQITAGTSGTLSIGSLTANKTYNIQFKTTRQATSTESKQVATVQTQTTYQYPYVSAVSKANLTIGNSQTLTLYNPLGRTVTVYMKPATANAISGGTTSGTSITFTPSASALYNSIPSATSGSATYYCTYSSQTVSTKSGTYIIDNSSGQQNPTFTASNWSYVANQTSLTNNNQVAIKENSTITVTVNTDAVAKNGASISSYKLEWGSITPITTTTTSGSISNGNSNILKVTAIDSRGYSTSTQKDLGSNYINYFTPTNSEKTTHRESGVGENTTLTLRGTFFNNTFGADGVQNAFTSAKYYVSTDNSTWSSGFNIPNASIDKSGNNYEINDFQIHANGTSGGFTVGQRYYLKVVLIDRIKTLTITNIIVTDGKIAVDVYQDSNGEYHRGVNGLADDNYALYVYGKINATGGFEGNIENANKSDTEKLTLTNPSSDTTYYLPFISGITNNEYYGLRGNNGISYKAKEGTTSAVGKAYLYLGNSTSSGTAGNKRGLLALYDTSSYYGAIYANSTLTANRNYYLPDATGTLALTSSTVTNADNLRTLLTNPTSTTTYYISFIAGATNNEYYAHRVNDGLKYLTIEGTTSDEGTTILAIGNSTTGGTAGNKRGYVRIYDTTAYYCQLYGTGSISANRNIKIPNNSGTIQIRPTNLYNNTTGATGTVTLSASSANYTYLDIYFYINKYI